MEIKRLGEIASLVRGVSYKPEDLHNALDENSIILLKNNNINEDGTISFENVVYVDRSNVSDEQLLKKGDIIVCASGSESLVGKSAAFNLEGEYTFGAFCKVVRPVSINSGYLKMFFLSSKYRADISLMAQGAIMKNLRNEHLLNLKIECPHLNEQLYKNEILSSVLKLIKFRKKQIGLLDNLLKSKFVEIFISSNSAWQYVTIKDVCLDARTGPFGSALHHDEFVDKGVFVLGIDNAVDNKFSFNKMRFITEKKYQELKRYTVHSGDVIITIMGTIGRSAIIPNNMPLAINTKHLACLTPDYSKVNSVFLCSLFQMHPEIQYQLTGNAKGAIMDGLNLGIIKNLKFRLPPLKEQNEFALIYSQINKIKTVVQKALDEAQLLFDSLMQQYFG